jgi:hypothetical protein
MQHFLNILARDVSLSRTVSLLNPRTPQPFPVLVIGTNPLHQFFQHENGTIVAPGSTTLRVTLADILGTPIDGALAITGAGDTEIVLAGCTAEDLASALNAIPSIVANGGVNVTGAWPSFLIAYREVGVVTAFTVSAALLTPNATAEKTVLTTGTISVRELVRLTLRTTPILQTTTFSVITPPTGALWAGWSGRLPLTGAVATAWIQSRGVLIGDYLQASTLLTVEVIDGSNATALYQSAVVIRANNFTTAIV